MCAGLLVLGPLAQADPAIAGVTYLANQGLMVERGDLRVLFDPLFRYRHDYYQHVPEALEQALFRGEPPFAEVAAVFISHYHDDHFNPELVLRLLRMRPGIRLFAPRQAVAALRAVATGVNEGVFRRVQAIDLAYGDGPLALTHGDLLIEAVRIPHSGWPDRVTEVENLAFRVTLGGDTTVLHLGDADVDPAHFAAADFWSARVTGMAFPPWWFLVSAGGREVLESRIRPRRVIGTHLPARPADRHPGLAGFDLFTRPGETRVIPFD